MAFNSNIPQPSDQISRSQADILENFTELNTFVGIDHAGFGTANEGKHSTATFPSAAAPGAVLASEVGLYAADSGGNPELFINKLTTQVPFTRSLKATDGWTYLPSGIIIQWGTSLMSGGASSVVVTLPLTYPTAHLSITASPNATPSGSHTDIIMAIATTSTATATAYRKTNYGSSCYFNYLSIGY